jgi:hypothetical protein
MGSKIKYSLGNKFPVAIKIDFATHGDLHHHNAVPEDSTTIVIVVALYSLSSSVLDVP